MELISQKQIKNQKILTKIDLQLLTELSDNDLLFCSELQTTYQFLENGSAFVVNDTSILSTALGGDTRFIGIAGVNIGVESIIESLSIKDNYITLNDIDTPTDITANNGGIILKGDTDKSILWNDITDSWNINQNVSITGDLDVDGDITYIETETLRVEDKNIEIGYIDTPTDDTANGGGITLKGATDKTIAWDKTSDNWLFNKGLDITGEVNVSDDLNLENTSYLYFGVDNVEGNCRYYISGNILTFERYEIHNYNDWFLPSKDELNKMYENLYLEGVGGFSNSYYWSSSELDINNAWYQYFDDGSQFTDLKSFDVRVRACRSFVKYIPNAYNLKDVGPGGGWIFYINNNLDNSYTYYECASSDQSISQIWSDVNLLVGTDTIIGSGKFNTRLIIEQSGHTDSAGKLCDDLSILNNGWYEKTRVTTDTLFNNQDTNINGDLEVEGTSKVTLGLKDTYVTTPIKLGSIIDTSFNTDKKSIVGAVNELKNELFWSNAGIVDTTLPTLTLNGDGTANIASTTVRMYSTTDFTGDLNEYTVAGVDNLTFTDGMVNQLICIHFVGDVPTYYVESDKYNINASNILFVYIVWRNGNTLYYHGNDIIGLGLANKLHTMDLQTTPYKLSLDGGLLLTETVTPNPRTILLSGGIVYAGATPNVVSAYNSSTDTLIFTYHVAGVWNFNDTELVYNNTQYDDGTDLQTLDYNKYVVRWFYRKINNTKTIFYVSGSSQYDNLIEAEAEVEIQGLPEVIKNNCLLVGKIIIRKSEDSGILYQSFSKPFSANGSNIELQNNFNVVEGNGVESGMVISINADTTKIDISSGTYYNSDNNTIVNYPGVTGVYIDDLTTKLSLITYIAISMIDNSVIQQTSIFTPTQRRDYIILGAAIHSNKTFINAINNMPDVAIKGLSQLNDLIDGLNVFNIEGNEFYGATGTLELNKSEGKIFKRGSNFTVDAGDNPHTKTMPEMLPVTNIRYRLSDGTEYADTNLVDLYYQNSPATKAPIGNNKYSIQRIVLFPSNLVRIQYGTAIYNSMALAKDALYTESFTLEQNMAENGLLRGFLIVKGDATDLSDPAQASFIGTDRFGQLPAGAMGGTFDHSNLTNLDYFSSAHTGFMPSDVVKEPTGFETRTTSTLSFDGATRIFTITPISDFNVWSAGVRYIKTIVETVTLTTDTDGLWYIYYGTDGVLACSQAVWAFVDGAVPVATVYYDTATNTGLICDERHGVIMDGMTHAYLHYAVGVRYISGLAGTFTNTTFSIGSGVLFDEDIRITIDPQTTCRVFYRSAGVYKFTAPQAKYYYDVAGVLRYDNASVLTPVTNNYYMAVWVFGTNDIDNPIYVLIGQRQDQKLADAEKNNVYENLNLETLPSQEMKLLYRVILRNFGGVATYIRAQDLRNISNLPAGTYTATDHNQLSNRDAAGNHTKLVPIEDTTTAIQFTQANGTTSILTLNTLNKLINIPDLTASQAVFTDASMNLISNAITGTGNVVMSSSPTIGSPIIDKIVDANSNEELIFTTTAAAVNEFTITNSATTDPVILQATGDDANIDIIIRPKGTGTTTVEGLLIATPVLTDLKLADTSADHYYVFTVNELTADRNVNLPLLIADDVFVFENHIQTLTNKTLTTPKINDTSLDHTYNFVGSELTADRNVNLPLLTGDDVFVFEGHIQTLTNKTLTTPVLTTPKINDTSLDHTYNFVGSELTADIDITLPLLTGNDVFVFQDHIQTLTNKTLTSPTLTTPKINDTTTDNTYIFTVNELTADRNVNLPLLLADDVFVFEGHIQTLTNKTLTSPKINDTSSDHTYNFTVNELIADRNVELPLLIADDVFVFENHIQTLTNKTLTTPTITTPKINEDVALTSTSTKLNYLTSATGTTGTTSTNIVFSTSPTLTTPKINDTSSDHTYNFTVNKLSANMNINLPLLLADDVFVFENHIQTLTNKTLTSPVINTSIIGSASFDVFNTTSTVINAFGASETLTIGGTPTTAITHNYSTNVTANATTKTINFGTGGDVGSTTNITMGSANGGTLTINNPLTNVNGTLSIYGDIYQYGAAYETHAEKVYTTDDLIVTRDGAVSALAANEYTGFQATKYDGTNDGQLVFDVNGIARVGDVGSLQPLATREETPNNTSIAFWNSTTVRFETSANLTYDGTSLYALSAIIPTIKPSIDSTTATSFTTADELTSILVIDTTGSYVNLPNLTASQAVFTDVNKNLVSNAITGSGNVVMSSSPVLTSPMLTAPKINDTSADNTYNFTVSELTANINVNLPLLLADDVFVFENHIQTLTNKTLTSPKINEDVILSTTATKLNYLTSATGTTGTTSTNIVFSDSPTIVTPTITTSAIIPTIYGSASTLGNLTLQGNDDDFTGAVLIKTDTDSNYATKAGALQVDGGLYVTKKEYIADTTDSNYGTKAGSLVTEGGAYIAKKTYIADTTESTSNTTGSIVTAGGVGIAKNLYVGTINYTFTLGATPDFDIDWHSVTYGNGKFVAVAYNGTITTRAMYSTDGITWNLGDTPDVNMSWHSVTYGNGKFVAVAYNGTITTRAMYSTDGINWSLGATPNVNIGWYSVTYGNGKFVAVAYDGTNTTRAMYSEFTKIGKIDLASDLYLNNYSYTYIGNGTDDGSWRFYINGTDLVYERLESSVWVEKGKFTG